MIRTQVSCLTGSASTRPIISVVSSIICRFCSGVHDPLMTWMSMSGMAESMPEWAPSGLRVGRDPATMSDRPARERVDVEHERQS